MSIINKVLKKYNRIPLWMTNVLAPFYYMIPEKLRYGKIYQAEKTELERISSLSPQALQAEQEQALQKLIHYAYQHVAYYHKLFDANHINPDDIKTEKDLYKIPFLTKELLVANRDDLISDEFDKSQLIYLTTSGSTGSPTGFYVQKESPMREWVYCQHMLAPFGKKPDDSKLVMRGKKFWAQDKGKAWQWDAFKRELSINILEMTPENMELYCKAIEKHKPELAYGYPSAMYTLCKYISIRPGGLKHQFKGFEAISEGASSEQRAFIEDTLNTKFFSFYGMSERVVIATNTLDFNGYEVQPMYGIAELIDDKGDVITTYGKNGELVGTSLLNYGMPLIRYRTGDISAWDKTDAQYGEVKGDKRRITNIQGRKFRDVLITKDGRPISMASLEVHSKIYEYMSMYQFMQEEVGKTTIFAVPLPGVEIDEIKKAEIEDTFNKRVNYNIDFYVELVDMIRPNANGKASIINQKLNVEQYLM